MTTKTQPADKTTALARTQLVKTIVKGSTSSVQALAVANALKGKTTKQILATLKLKTANDLKAIAEGSAASKETKLALAVISAQVRAECKIGDSKFWSRLCAAHVYALVIERSARSRKG